MPRKKYPPVTIESSRVSGETPPHLLAEKERIEWAVQNSIIAANSIGGTPKEK